MYCIMTINIFSNPKKSTDIKEDGFEKCVVCNKLTDIRYSVPVQQRKTYMIGVGQLCRKCCFELYHTDDLRDM